VPLGLLTCCALVWQSSAAAFTATTSNPENSWTTGKVELASTPGTAVFTAGKLLVPGSSGSKCITVTYKGSVDTAIEGVRLWGVVKNTSDADLAAKLEVTVQMSRSAVPGTPDVDCASFPTSSFDYAPTTLSTFPKNYTSGIGHANGTTVGDWRPFPTTDVSRTYKISYRLPADVANADALQGKTVEMAFTWEVQSYTPGS
jgi:hypothetical protein